MNKSLAPVALASRVARAAAVLVMALTLSVLADGTRTISISAYNRGEDGVLESVDLAFGECATNFAADFYVSYGASQGSSVSHQTGWDTVVKLSGTPVTAATTNWHYAMPPGWSDTVNYLRFFFVAIAERPNSATNYYAAEGLVSLFDGIDNVNSGKHDAIAGRWINLVDNTAFDWKVAVGQTHPVWPVWEGGNCLKLTNTRSGFIFAPNGLGRIWTLELVISSSSGTFLDGPGDSMWCDGAPVKYAWRDGGDNRPPLTGWSKNQETLAIMSAQTYSAAWSTNMGLSKKDNVLADGKSSTAELCVGGGIYDGDAPASGLKIHGVRVYNRILTEAELAENSRIDGIRYYGKAGDLPDIGTIETETVVGASEVVIRDLFVQVDATGNWIWDEVSATVPIKLSGFEIGVRGFSVYPIVNGARSATPVATGLKADIVKQVTVAGLEPGCEYTISLQADDGELVSVPGAEITFQTPMVQLDPAVTTAEGRDITITAYRSGTPGKSRGSVDLAFGACSDDWKGYLYIAYGPRSGGALVQDGWEHFEKVSESPITASVTNFHCTLPVGWMETVWSVRFFLTMSAETLNALPARDAYPQEGLIAMWDGRDNAGTGTHDNNATVWKDLVGTNDFNFTGAVSFGENCIRCSTAQQSQSDWRAYLDYAHDVTTNITYEILYKQSGGNCMTAVMNAFGNLFIWNNGGEKWTQFADRAANVTRMPYPGNNKVVHNSIAVSGYRQISAYLNGVDSGYYVDDHWYAGTNTTLFSEMSRGFNRGATGEIYVMRIYNRKLSAGEVVFNYNRDMSRYEGRDCPVSSSATVFARPSRDWSLFIVR